MESEIMKSDLLTPKELAFELKPHITYVYAMCKSGFKMPGGTATLKEAREWLRDHPEFTRDKAYSRTNHWPRK